MDRLIDALTLGGGLLAPVLGSPWFVLGMMILSGVVGYRIGSNRKDGE